jgi:hypothetical protein
MSPDWSLAKGKIMNSILFRQRLWESFLTNTVGNLSYKDCGKAFRQRLWESYLTSFVGTPAWIALRSSFFSIVGKLSHSPCRKGILFIILLKSNNERICLCGNKFVHCHFCKDTIWKHCQFHKASIRNHCHFQKDTVIVGKLSHSPCRKGILFII